MEPTLSSGAGSGNSGTYTPEIAESLRFEEEIQSLMRLEPPAAGGGSSFTALLGLPANQAVELLHDPESGDSPAASSGPVAGAGAGAGDGWLFRLRDPRAPQFPLPCSPPTFPTNAALVERAARFSVFAAEDSPEAAFSDGPSASGDQRRSPKPKVEPPDSDACPPISGEGPQQRPAKRKEAERSKAKASTKKSKAVEESAAAAEKEKLPYVHVRARRGQATDSHSLAERARREKINARMKLLQELVPGCSKISGTALVLDEIINHVQALQRQVEFLSMRLAAVNPRIDFSALDSFLSVECGRVTAGNVTMEPAAWHRPPEQQQEQQQIWHVDLMHPEQAGASPPLSMWERNDASRVFANPGSSVFGYDPASRPNPVVTLHSSQLKTEL